MEAGRLCEEPECCEWGEANWLESECGMCEIIMIPAVEHEKDEDSLYENYYGSPDDDGDICYVCLTNLTNSKLKEKYKK